MPLAAMKMPLAAMNKTESDDTAQLDAAEIRAALGRIVASPSLNKSPQLAHFLSFVVDETLAGRAERIKAYTIAADAFGRDADFDAQNDPIVRVEAGRLRRALKHYYSNGGAGDPIVIELPRGHYVPVFKANKTRARFLARVRGASSRLAAMLREHYRLVLLIVIVATCVWVTLELLQIMLADMIWPAIVKMLRIGRSV